MNGPLDWRPGAEPISGYRLQEFVGEGQFGQVWKASGPSPDRRLAVALKRIDLRGMSTAGLKEYHGVRQVAPLRHPNLVPIHGVWLLDEAGEQLDQSALDRLKADAKGAHPELPNESAPRPALLVIAMGLGDKTLAQRLKECQAKLVGQNESDVDHVDNWPETAKRRLEELKDKGRAGIPIDELLEYMREAAKGVDYLNRTHTLEDGTKAAIQHRDIKPTNIILVGGAAQICDFGLARALSSDDGDVRKSKFGIVGSPPYMAPECIFSPEPSEATDQYSLAMTYCELRTGDIPFDDQSESGIVQAQLNGDLDLGRLSMEECEVIMRATSRRPDDRFPNASEMVDALRKAVEESVGFDDYDISPEDDHGPIQTSTEPDASPEPTDPDRSVDSNENVGVEAASESRARTSATETRSSVDVADVGHTRDSSASSSTPSSAIPKKSTYRHHLFISYARRNERWVLQFREALEEVLREQLDDVDIWIDTEDISPNRKFEGEIAAAIDNSATLLIILSERYLASDWCKQERERFAQRPGSDERIFLIRYENVAPEKCPPELQSLNGFQFFKRDTKTGIAMPVKPIEDEAFHEELYTLRKYLLEVLEKDIYESVESEEPVSNEPVIDTGKPIPGREESGSGDVDNTGRGPSESGEPVAAPAVQAEPRKRDAFFAIAAVAKAVFAKAVAKTVSAKTLFAIAFFAVAAIIVVVYQPIFRPPVSTSPDWQLFVDQAERILLQKEVSRSELNTASSLYTQVLEYEPLQRKAHLGIARIVTRRQQDGWKSQLSIRLTSVGDHWENTESTDYLIYRALKILAESELDQKSVMDQPELLTDLADVTSLAEENPSRDQFARTWEHSQIEELKTKAFNQLKPRLAELDEERRGLVPTIWPNLELGIRLVEAREALQEGRFADARQTLDAADPGATRDSKSIDYLMYRVLSLLTKAEMGQKSVLDQPDLLTDLDDVTRLVDENPSPGQFARTWEQSQFEEFKTKAFNQLEPHLGELDEERRQLVQKIWPNLEFKLFLVKAREALQEERFTEARETLDEIAADAARDPESLDYLIHCALSILAEADLDPKSVLDQPDLLGDLARFTGLVKQHASRDQYLTTWEHGQIERWKAKALRHVHPQLKTLDDAQRELVQTIWPNLEFELLLVEAREELDKEHYKGAHTELDKAEPLAAEHELWRVQGLRVHVLLRDAEQDATVVLPKLRDAVSKVRVDSLPALREALEARVQRQPDWLDEAISTLAGMRNDATPWSEFRPCYIRFLMQRTINAVQSGEAMDYERFRRDCEEIRNAGTNAPVVEACWAECLVELFGAGRWSDADDASRLAIEKISELTDPDLTSYVRYARALVLYRDPAETNLTSAVEELKKALTPGVSPSLRVPGRRWVAAEMLAKRVNDLRTDEDFPAPAFTPGNADLALACSETARDLLKVPRASDEVHLRTDLFVHTILAYAHCTDRANKVDIIRAVSKEWRSTKPIVAHSDASHLKLALASAFSQGDAREQEKAAEHFADVLDQLPHHSGGPKAGRQWYQFVVVPAMKFAGKFPVEPPTGDDGGDALKKNLAKIYAAQGTLIHTDYDVRKFLKETHEGSAFDPYERAHQAYKNASILSAEAGYYVNQGETLKLMELEGRSLLDVITELKSLAKHALDVDSTSSDAHGLHGYASLLESRTQDNDVAQKKHLLTNALNEYDRALDEFDQADNPSAKSVQQYSQLVGRSTAHVELAFLEDDKRVHLFDAAKDAEAATKFDAPPQPEYAWIAWGNAEEDIAYYLKQKEYYPTAIDRFTRAVQEAVEAGRSTALAYLSRGRTRYRYAKDGGHEQLGPALDDLRRAVTEAELRHTSFDERRDGRLVSEANFWISQIHRVKSEFQDAERAASAAARLALEYDESEWPTYQIESAELALKSSQIPVAKKRAERLLESEPSGRGTLSDIVFRARVVVLNTTDSLADKIELTATYLTNYRAGDRQALPYRLRLMLWRSETIVLAKATNHYDLAAKDAQEVWKCSESDDKLRSLYARARMTLGLIESLRYHYETFTNETEKQKTGLKACEHLEVAIPFLSVSDSIRARLSFGTTARYLLAGPPQLDAKRRKDLKDEAHKMLEKIVKSDTIDKSSQDYQRADKLLRWFNTGPQ